MVLDSEYKILKFYKKLKSYGVATHNPLGNTRRMEDILYDMSMLLEETLEKAHKNSIEIKNVIFNNPATIVYWKDGSRTVVRRCGDENFDKEKGLAMAISKRALGDKGNYNNIFHKWCE